MTTLLQTLLLQTLAEETDSILRSYIETILPKMEREFALIPALGGSETAHYEVLFQLGDPYAKEKAQRWANRADQSLLVHVLNGLLTAWNLVPYLSQPLSEVEKYLLCLGLTLHDYNKYCNNQGEETPHAAEVAEILELCEKLGNQLNFQSFWSEWKQYLPEIAYLAQNTQYKAGVNIIPANWPQFTIPDRRRLEVPLRRLLAFGDVAVHIGDPGDIKTETAGDRLREHLRFLGIHQQLIYHRLRDTLGILTNGIHNATIRFAKELEWEPLLYFTQGVIYLAPVNSELPEQEELQSFIWQQISQLLGDKMSGGEIGFKRDGKGLKVSPQTTELFDPAQLIRYLPDVIAAKVANVKDPATPKRLEKLALSDTERELLKRGSDIRADRIAEFIVLAQRELFSDSSEFITWMLEALQLASEITPEQTQEQSGGVNYGWYRVAAHYIAKHPTWDLEQVTEQLSQLAEKLATWGAENDILPEHKSPTREVFYSYLNHYLEVQGWESTEPSFESEFVAYTIAKTKESKQPICSLGSGEFISEDQVDSVVLFKPQQYSNKNSLGGRQIKRGISKIWSLEMLLRQAFWSARAGKFEEQNPIFLYIFPAYVYSPQTARAIRVFVNEMKRTNLWDIRKHWLGSEMDLESLRSLPWLNDNEIEEGRFSEDKYAKGDLPFLATIYTTTRGKTTTEAWIEPAFLALSLPLLLGVKVIATSSFVPLYNSDRDFLESTILDGPAGFWNLLNLPTSLRIQDFSKALEKLLVVYSLHLETRSSPPDARWQAFNGTVREVMTDVLNVFALANKKLREDKREASPNEVYRFWNYAQIFSQGDESMQEKLQLTKRLVGEYRQFYQVGLNESSHSILLPLSKALEEILSVPESWDDEELILQGAGQLQAALDRQEVYKRPLLKDKSIAHAIRQQQELEAIQTFMTTCVKDLFGGMCKGDRALLQENRNRIKSGAEFAYRLLALEDKKAAAEEKTKA